MSVITTIFSVGKKSSAEKLEESKVRILLQGIRVGGGGRMKVFLMPLGDVGSHFQPDLLLGPHLFGGSPTPRPSQGQTSGPSAIYRTRH